MGGRQARRTHPSKTANGWSNRRLFDTQLSELFDGPREDGLVTANDDGSLDEFGMIGHDADQLIIAQTLACDISLVRIFVGSQGVRRF